MVKLNYILATISVLLISHRTIGQSSVGIRFGEPTGITYKIDNGSDAFEFIIGRSHITTGPKYYSKRFNSWYKKNDFGYYYHIYDRYASSSAVTLQGRYLIHKALKQFGDYDVKNLDLYYGFGAVLRYQEIDFAYSYRLSENSTLIADEQTIRDIDLGADAIIGIEYKFENAPINVFLEISMFIELIDNPFIFWPQGGLGGRYIF